MSESKPQFDPLVDELPSRYVIGIDLGTTNSAVTYVDTQEKPWQVHVLAIPQVVAPGHVEARDTLPSFHFEDIPSQVSGGALRLPWSTSDPGFCVGFHARDEGAKSPSRMIASAKSWLCHSGVDRTADLLPWQGADDVERLSPVDVTARYLGHIRDAWNHKFKMDPLSGQDIVITLPASFDEVARELTVEAAHRADLPRVVLIEEPQAAFYAWVYKHRDSWHDIVEPGHTVLVCDIGGGTSDFTLIRVQQDTSDDAESVQFHRVAVGEHLILGGDNLDVALARYTEDIIDKKLSPQQWDVLVRVCRRVKETLLGEDPPDEVTISLPASGSKLIGGGIQTVVDRSAVQQLLIGGFLPKVKIDSQPLKQQSGFREFGLPFASDPAITKHLTSFLGAHLNQDLTSAQPDVVLFNGGFFASPILREQLLEVLTSWYRPANGPDWRPIVLDNDRLDLAVARGAAYFGMVRRGEGVKINAALARSYYMAIDGEQDSCVCVVPGDTQPGQAIDLSQRVFDLTISEPVEFPLLVSSTRLTDSAGELLPVDVEAMRPLPPIRTVIRTQRRSETGVVPVTLRAQLSEIGTIELWCHQQNSDRRWRLEFDIRSTTQTDMQAHESAREIEGFINEEAWDQCEQVLGSVFGGQATEKPDGLVKRMAGTLELARNDWPTTLLRRIWDSLMQFESGRRKSPAHELRWLNLLGYALRPGYGLSIDDWRVAETWRAIRDKLVHNAAASRTESLILWRRIAGGLSRGQQQALAEPLLSSVRSVHRSLMTGKRTKSATHLAPHESSEVWRLLGSLELLPVATKNELGGLISDLVSRKKYEKVRSPMTWALGRLGQRVPVYGPLNTVVSAQQATSWTDRLLDLGEDQPQSQLALMQLTRKTNDRYRDIDDKKRRQVANLLSDQGVNHLATLVMEGGELDSTEQDRIVGEALPKGLRLS